MPETIVIPILNVLGTYAVHSTVLLLLALALSGRMLRLDGRSREAVLRAGVFGAVATTALQCTIGGSPFAGWLDFTLAGSGAAAAAETFMLVPAPGGVATPELAVPTPALGWPLGWPFSFLDSLVLTYGAGLAIQLVLHCVASRRIKRLLRGRSQVTDPTARTALAQLCREVGIRRQVRLTFSASTPGPIAFGIWTPEICLPATVLTKFDRHEIRCVLGHELAHLFYRDPIWTRLYQLLATLAFFQPLHAIARRRLHDLAELRCDHLVVELDGEGTALAGTLLRVAEWQNDRTAAGAAVLPAVQCSAGVQAMAQRPSCLAHRVRTALANDAPATRPWTRVLALTVLTGIAICTPGLGLRAERGRPAFAESATPATPDAELRALRHRLLAIEAKLGADELDDETLDLFRLISERLQAAEQTLRLIRADARASAPIHLNSAPNPESDR